MRESSDLLKRTWGAGQFAGWITLGSTTFAVPSIREKPKKQRSNDEEDDGYSYDQAKGEGCDERTDDD